MIIRLTQGYSLTNVLSNFTNQIKSVLLNQAKFWPYYGQEKTKTNGFFGITQDKFGVMLCLAPVIPQNGFLPKLGHISAMSGFKLSYGKLVESFFSL